MEKLEGIEGQGWFWRADAPDARVPGTLQFQESGACELRTVRSETTFHFLPLDGSTWRVHGSVNGVAVTLEECQEFDTTLMTGAQRIDVPQVITGLHHGDDPQFQGLMTTIENLYGWVDVSVLGNPGPARGIGESLAFTVIPRDADTHTSDGVTLALRHGWSGRSGKDSVSISQHKRLELVYQQPQPLQALMARAGHLESLLTLAAQQQSQLQTVKLAASGDADRFEHRLWRRAPFQGTTRREVKSGLFMFSYDDLDGLAGITRWLRFCDDMPLVVGLLAAQHQPGTPYVENLLTNAANAAETYHRSRFESNVRPKDEYKVFREGLVQLVPREHQEWLNGVLSGANGKRLLQRLSELCDHAGPTFSTIAPESTAFCKSIRDLRNGLTHPDRDLPKHAPDSIHSVARATQFLVLWCVLKDLRLEDSALERVAQSPPVRLWQHLAERRCGD